VIQVAAVPILDQAILDDLRALDRAGEGSFLRQIIGVFEQQASEIVEQLTAAASSGDTAQLAALAHKLKGSARTVGAVELGDQCERLERETRGGELQELNRQLEDLTTAVTRARNSLLEQI
jgi:two-component system sensor histidine kinase/response regulator